MLEDSLREVGEVARAVGAREVSPVEVVEVSLRELDVADGRLHVVACSLAERALAQAAQAEAAVVAGEPLGPLHGVPVGVKDLYDIEGEPTAAGSTILAGNVADRTATAVARLESAGAIPVAKLAMTEFAGAHHHPAFPAPINPYGAEHHPGGSSSGSAVAVAAGALPVALGSDTVASIRLPAAWNGCVGYKPTYGRISRDGVVPLAASYDHCGPLAASVADADLVVRAMAGHSPLDVTSRRDPYPVALPADLSGVVVGVDPSFMALAPGPGVAERCLRVVELLDDAGAEVREVTVPLHEEAAEPYFVLLAAEVAWAHRRWFPERRADYTAGFVSLLDAAEAVSRDQVVEADLFRLGFRDAVAHLFGDIDVLVTPTVGVDAPPTPAADEGGDFDLDTIRFLRFTWLWNLCGAPALSIPWGIGEWGGSREHPGDRRPGRRCPRRRRRAGGRVTGPGAAATGLNGCAQLFRRRSKRRLATARPASSIAARYATWSREPVPTSPSTNCRHSSTP